MVDESRRLWAKHKAQSRHIIFYKTIHVMLNNYLFCQSNAFLPNMHCVHKT